MDNNMKKKALWYVKLGITFALLAFVLIQADWRELSNSMAMIRNELIVAWFLLVVINIVLSALKWVVLLKPFYVGLSLPGAVRLYFITMFFNNFLPGSVGGDGYRGYQIYKSEGQLSAACFPIFMERVSGLFMLVLLGGLAGAYLYATLQDFVSMTIALSGFGVTIAIIGFFSMVTYKRKILSLKMITSRKRLHDLVDKFFQNVLIYKVYPKVILWVIVITLLFYFILFYSRFLLVIAAGSYVSFVAVVGIVMVSNVLAMLPLSINGYGILDLSFVGLLSYYGADYEKAVLVMVLYRCMQMLVGSFGGLLYAFSSGRNVAEGKKDSRSNSLLHKGVPEEIEVKV